MSWTVKLAPVLFVCACGGTTLTVGPDGGGGKGNEESGGASSGGTENGGTAGDGAGGRTLGGAAGSPVQGGAGGGIAGAGSGGRAGAGTGGGPTREPLKHRPSQVVCGVRPPAQDAGGPQGASPDPMVCTTDADCVSGANGRCISGRLATKFCTYDACFDDTDCESGSVCQCSPATQTSVGNHCSAPGCRIDADCPGSFCSPTFGTCGNYSGVIGYACHTTADECVDDTDCIGKGPGAYCMHDPMVGHWICSSSQCAG